MIALYANDSDQKVGMAVNQISQQLDSLHKIVDDWDIETLDEVETYRFMEILEDLRAEQRQLQEDACRYAAQQVLDSLIMRAYFEYIFWIQLQRL